MEINERLKKLRGLMKENNIGAYIVPTYDPHQSEYLADYYKTRQWISGFTGSAGLALITMDEAKLWTDGRYFIQAEKELAASEFELMKMATPGYPTYGDWLKENLEDSASLAFDGNIFPQSELEKLEKLLSKKNIKISGDFDFIGELWTDRMDPPMSEAFVHDIKYTGLRADEKIEELRKLMAEKSASHTIIGSLDDIAWLYNIRARDVKCNPVLISYGLVSMDKAYLFTDERKISEEVRKHLEDNSIELRAYEDVREALSQVGSSASVYLDKSMINSRLYQAIPQGAEVIDGINLSSLLKARKNETELKNQKHAYLKDGIALVNFMYWLDKNLGQEEITELSASEKLEDFRKEQELFLEPSFDTIAGYKENAAMMHYKAEEGKSNASLKREGMLLVDSGGQYHDGTTDITRTMALGPVSPEEIKDYTLTLKGHINLLSARFLQGVTGSQLDILSRYPLWQEGLDYKCGTGHGVGFFLNVHEGPQSLSPRTNTVVLEEGMVLTVEPGVYKAGKHGIRIENVAVVAKDIETEAGGQFLRFDTMSFVPIDLDPVDKELLSENELAWLNEYHKKTYEKLSPYLKEEVKEWLKDQTRSI